jgi:hypothetical protein
VRQSLEQRLFDISSVLDETDYDLVPGRLRESLLLRRRRPPSGDASCAAEGVEPLPSDEAASSTSVLNSPVNVTQLSNNDEYSGRYGTRLTSFRFAFLTCGSGLGIILACGSGLGVISHMRIWFRRHFSRVELVETSFLTCGSGLGVIFFY